MSAEITETNIHPWSVITDEHFTAIPDEHFSPEFYQADIHQESNDTDVSEVVAAGEMARDQAVEFFNTQYDKFGLLKINIIDAASSLKTARTDLALVEQSIATGVDMVKFCSKSLRVQRESLAQHKEGIRRLISSKVAKQLSVDEFKKIMNDPNVDMEERQYAANLVHGTTEDGSTIDRNSIWTQLGNEQQALMKLKADEFELETVEIPKWVTNIQGCEATLAHKYSQRAQLTTTIRELETNITYLREQLAAVTAYFNHVNNTRRVQVVQLSLVQQGARES
ncbi:hypothetical protein H7097_03775 [Aeromicrobium sp.]|nr:hypothetical protein [Candidatus Saccharibacteria bacterium]